MEETMARLKLSFSGNCPTLTNAYVPLKFVHYTFLIYLSSISFIIL